MIKIRLNLNAKKNHVDLILKQFQLTNREADIVRHVLLGKTNKEIAAALFIEETTVKVHLRQVFKKTAKPNRSQLMALFVS